VNYISPVNHPESPLSGSTIESMVDRAKELGLGYFACTDNGSLSAILKGYTYAKKKDIKFIAGFELYFKDDQCPIIEGTPSEQIKYFKLVIHTKDQNAYQHIVKMTSDPTKRKIRIGSEEKPVFNWTDIEELVKYKISICTSNIEGMVAKHILVGREDLSMAYYERLRALVGPENFYPTILPFSYDKYWNTMVRIKSGGIEFEIPAFDRIETDHYARARAIELTRQGNRHKYLKYVYINKVKFPVSSKYQYIESAKLVNDFQELPGGDIQTKANKMILSFAEKFGDMDRLLINNYAYYATKEDKVVQDMKLGEEKRIHQHQYMSSTEDVVLYLNSVLELPEMLIQMLIKNSYKWAQQFDNFELNYDYKLPKPEGDPKKLLVDVVKKVGRMRWDNPQYVSQFREEFELLTNNGVIDLIPYFLPIVDVYDFYKNNGHLTGPARGSAGGFLISYLMGITHVDPIKYGLSSSRFLTIDRVQQGNLPDIDCDLESRIPLVGKDGNSGYLFNKYGNKAAQISTRTLLRIKSAILDANRFVNGGRVEDLITKLSKSLPNTPQGISDHDFVFGYEDSDGNHVEGLLEKSEDLQKYAVDRPNEWDIVKRALSLSRQYSRHACAYVISDTAIEDTIPIMEVGGVKRVTQPEAKQCEWAGLIKYDFLVVLALKDINLAMRYINKKHGVTPETGNFIHQDKETYIWDLPEDQGVFKDLGDGKTESVFQLNTVSVTPFVKQIRPTSIIDCATITSLVRPGPLDFIDESTGRNMAEEYIYRKHGMSKGDLPILDELLPETYGVLVFQEQVTKIAQELGQMSVIDAENVRIGMGKKKIKLLTSLKPIFVEGAAKKVGLETAEKVWSMMATFARYGFNKSHAVAYSVISYACAFLKHHYPLEWWASVLSNADDKEINEVFYKYVKDMVLPPDINTSTEQMEVDYSLKKIRNKLSMISGIGKNAAEKIINGRPYSSIKDFVNKKVCGVSMTKKLIHVGVLDSLFKPDDDLMDKMHKYELAAKEVDFERKLAEYDKKIPEAKDEQAIAKVVNNKNKMIEKGPKAPKIDSTYIGLTPKKDFLIKKSIFPTMNLNLQKVLDSNSKQLITQGVHGKMIANSMGYDNLILNGESLQHVDNINVINDTYFCVSGYVMDASEFTYQGGARKALKLIIDSSGYISEKVLWPDYNTGELNYPPALKKGCIAYFFYNKRPGKPYTNIKDVIVEEESLLS